jgi:hypothetical protein
LASLNSQSIFLSISWISREDTVSIIWTTSCVALSRRISYNCHTAKAAPTMKLTYAAPSRTCIDPTKRSPPDEASPFLPYGLFREDDKAFMADNLSSLRISQDYASPAERTTCTSSKSLWKAEGKDHRRPRTDLCVVSARLVGEPPRGLPPRTEKDINATYYCPLNPDGNCSEGVVV